MNTLIHVIVITGLSWLAYWLFDNSASAVPGLMIIGIILIFLAWMIQAVVEDAADFQKRRRRRR